MSKYSKQFKLSAIQAFLDRGRGFRHIAAQFQIDPTLLRRWVEAYRVHGEASLNKPGGHYSVEFKLGVIHRKLRDNLSLRATAALFNLGNSTLVRRWQEQYYSGGSQSLSNRKEMLVTAMRKAPRKPVETASKPIEELTRAELLERLAMLEVENAYLKKLEVRRGEGEAEDSQEKTRLVAALRKRYSLTRLLKVADLPRSTYYYQLGVLAAGDQCASLKAAIQEISHRHRGRYGYRRITSTLRSEGQMVNSKKVRRLMVELDLKCTVRLKKYKSYRGLMGEAAPNILKRDFKAEQPNQKWVTDVTEFKVAGEKLYLSPVMDLYNGEIVAYHTATRPRFTLVGEMLEAAINRLPAGSNPLLHSDQGWHYRYPDYCKRLKEAGLEQSMSRKGNCLDNAAMESFFGTLKSEYFYRERFENVAELKAGLDEYIHYYNHDRIKMKLNGLSPVAYRVQAEIG
ncbi:IS3 family transposase [Pseudomonas putida]|uniref:IS3 family transposase n=1 Tax=Pseudomonas putida TaxID=303 RepID=UPI000A2F5AD2|nr:IS3 family transposase [Pseudomonas putida]